MSNNIKNIYSAMFKSCKKGCKIYRVGDGWSILTQQGVPGRVSTPMIYYLSEEYG